MKLEVIVQEWLKYILDCFEAKAASNIYVCVCADVCNILIAP